MMNQQDHDRYVRQIIFPPLGQQGQERLLAASAILIGCGANGTVIANTLARAGVGKLVIVDRDFVELNNLQRQILFDEDDVARSVPKAIAAAEKLKRINSSIQVKGIVTDVNAESIEELIQGASIVLDGTDNFETRFLINDACIKNNIAWIYGGAVASYGMSMTIVPRETACLRCVFRQEPEPGTLPTCDTAGVIAPIVNVIGSIVSAESIKYLSGGGTRNPGMIHVDLWENEFQTFAIPRRADCIACVQNKFEYLEGSRAGMVTTFLCGRDAVQVNPGKGHTLNLSSLTERLKSVGQVSMNEYLVKLSIDHYELTIFPDARAIIKGTEDSAIARSLYAKYVGV